MSPLTFLHLLVTHSPLCLSVLARENIFSLIASNTVWSAALLYYTYLTFLGYTSNHH